MAIAYLVEDPREAVWIGSSFLRYGVFIPDTDTCCWHRSILEAAACIDSSFEIRLLDYESYMRLRWSKLKVTND